MNELTSVKCPAAERIRGVENCARYSEAEISGITVVAASFPAFADAEGTACIMNILREERDSGRTVIVISHDDRLDAIADHIFNLK